MVHTPAGALAGSGGRGPAGAGGSAAVGGNATGGAGGEGAAGAPVADAGPPGAITPADKLDLLFMIDNSISMADKQKLFAATVPDLVKRLVSPSCVDPTTGERSPTPSDPAAACPAPLEREFAPVRDLHIGIISSSLGSYGSDACVDEPSLNDPIRDEMNDDHAHLIGTRPRAVALGLAIDPAGFLSWSAASGDDLTTLSSTFQSLVEVTGEKGCGFEAPLESWYRFLVDPAPYEQVAVVPCSAGTNSECAEPQGLDSALLAQRAAFLRQDSVVAVVMLTDENDCSVRPVGQMYYSLRTIDLPASTSVCETDPNDPCCAPCLITPSGCDPDPTCDDGGTFRRVPSVEDHLNLRCWEQKRRFGVDFMFPVSRYVNALTQVEICPDHADLDVADCPTEPVPNLLFGDPSSGAPGRQIDQVYLMGIVGVPWQDLAATVDPNGTPWPSDELHFLTAAQMHGRAADGVARDTWADILGTPAASPPVAARDPLMDESIDPRTGTNPATGAVLAPPGAGYLENPINGHERTVFNNDDLQYACIFPLPEPVDCVEQEALGRGCDCNGLENYQGNPLCQAADGNYGETQLFGKAYPGLRMLEVLERIGDGAVVGSICPANVDDPTRQDYGYRPALDALAHRLEQHLSAGR